MITGRTLSQPEPGAEGSAEDDLGVLDDFTQKRGKRVISMADWWFGTMDFYETFPSYWEFHQIPTDFHSMIYQRGWYTNHQAVRQPIGFVSFTVGNSLWLLLLHVGFKPHQFFV